MGQSSKFSIVLFFFDSFGRLSIPGSLLKSSHYLPSKTADITASWEILFWPHHIGFRGRLDGTIRRPTLQPSPGFTPTIRLIAG
jgi:hypothetical protein